MPRVSITVPEKNPQPYRFPLDCQIVTIGRAADNDIVVDSGSVSSHHAEMRRVRGGFELHDCGSTNGIKLDDVRLDSISLENGENVTIGDVTFDFQLSADEASVLAVETRLIPAAVRKEESALPLEPIPASKPAQAYIPREKSGAGVGSFFLMAVLMLAAFYAGLHLSFQNATKGSLLDALKLRAAQKLAESLPPPPAPAPPAK